jgi:hypothetical protein
VGLAKKRFRNDRNLCARGGSLDGGAQTCATRPDDKNVMLMRDVLGH